MKRFILLSMLLLVLAVSVSAQYNAVSVGVMNQVAPAPAPISVRTAVVPPQEDCPTMCKRLASQGMDIFIRCMHDRCKEDCESSCRKMYGGQSQNCIEKFCKPQVPEQPQETCEQGCDKEYKICLEKTVGLNAGGIKSACENNRQKCLQDRCGQPPKNCEQGCDDKRDECLRTTVGITPDSIKAACERMHGECMKEQCGKPEMPPKSCEEKCAELEEKCDTLEPLLRENCVFDVRLMCMNKCAPPSSKPECPPPGCEDKCTKLYYDCASSGGTDCAERTADCLNSCRPGKEPAPDRCRQKCVRDEKRCVDECGQSEMPDKCKEKCIRASIRCVDECHPPESCEDKCATIKDDCAAKGLDENTCRKEIRDCLRGCQPQPPEKCEDRCAAIKFDCISNLDEKSCQMKIRECLRECQPQPEQGQGQVGMVRTPGKLPSPKDLAGLNPQPEPPSWWHRFIGWFNG